MDDLENTENEELASINANILVACRDDILKNGTHSLSAHAIFREFEEKWRKKIRWYAADKLMGNNFYAEDLVEETFEKAWIWVSGKSPLIGPQQLLRTCLERAHADLMRRFHGRSKVGTQLKEVSTVEQSLEAMEKPGTDARFPLSLERANRDVLPLIDQISDGTDVEAELLAKETFREAISSVPSKYRDCFICRVFLRLSVRETQLKLGLTYDQVTKYTHRVAEILEAALTDTASGEEI